MVSLDHLEEEAGICIKAEKPKFSIIQAIKIRIIQ